MPGLYELMHNAGIFPGCTALINKCCFMYVIVFYSGCELFSDAFKYAYDDDGFILTVQAKVYIMSAMHLINARTQTSSPCLTEF